MDGKTSPAYRFVNKSTVLLCRPEDNIRYTIITEKVPLEQPDSESQKVVVVQDFGTALLENVFSVTKKFGNCPCLSANTQ